jgi:site-specific recombinase XerD
MDFTNLREHYQKLLDYLAEDNYTESYIRRVKENVLWILKNEKNNIWQSYLDIYKARKQKPYSKLYKKNLRQAFTAIQQFDLYEEYPNRKAKNCLIKHGAYHQLIPEFKSVIDYFTSSEIASDLKKSTVNGSVSSTAVFLYEMQRKGINNLDRISEEDVLSFFTDDEGYLTKCSSYKKSIAAVLKVAAGWREHECTRLLSYLPQIRPRRKNIKYLTPEEVEAIRSAIDDKNSELSLRNRAIGNLLFFTGIRGCDIAEMMLTSIDWEADEIHIPQQQKTSRPLVLPLTAKIGNSILDYHENERPDSADDHLFLGELYPHYPFKAKAVWYQSSKIYKAASIRQGKGDRRGTHLFRHNVATSLLDNGVARPIITETLGQSDPVSLNPYLHTAFEHLKKCALSIGEFPIDEGVFHI